MRTQDDNSGPYLGEIALTVGTSYKPQRSLKVVCMVAGNVSVTYSDGSTGVWPVVVGTQTLPLAVAIVNSGGTTAVATYFNVK